MAVLIALHILAAVVWVGGMFFAYMALRPCAGTLPPETRLGLWRGVLGRFFPWVWACIAVLLASGYGMIFLYLGGFAGTRLSVHVMQAIGIVMMMLFAHLYFAPWRRFSAAVDTSEFSLAARYLNQIRYIVAVNLVLGLITIVVGSAGRFW